MLQSAPKPEGAINKIFYCDHHPCILSFKRAFCFFTTVLKHSRYLLQLLPRTGLNLCYQSSTHHYDSINTVLGIAWEKKEKKKKEHILKKKKRFYHLQTVYFNCTCTASQLSFFSSIGHLYPPPSPPFFFSLEVLLKFSMSSDFFLRKKMVNGLTYNTCTTYNIFTVTIQFPLVKQF